MWAVEVCKVALRPLTILTILNDTIIQLRRRKNDAAVTAAAAASHVDFKILPICHQKM